MNVNDRATEEGNFFGQSHVILSIAKMDIQGCWAPVESGAILCYEGNEIPDKKAIVVGSIPELTFCALWGYVV